MIHAKQQLSDMFDDAISQATADADPSKDFARVFINHRKLNPPIIVKPQPVSSLTSETVLSEVERHLHTEGNLDMDDSFSGKLKIRDVSIDLDRKRSSGPRTSRYAWRERE